MKLRLATWMKGIGVSGPPLLMGILHVLQLGRSLDRHQKQPIFSQIWGREFLLKYPSLCGGLLEGNYLLTVLSGALGSKLIPDVTAAEPHNWNLLTMSLPPVILPSKCGTLWPDLLGFFTMPILSKGALDCWWQIVAKNEVYKMLLHITPCYTLWEIWKARNAKRYDSKNISMFRVTNQILFNVQVHISEKFSKMDTTWIWDKVCYIVEQYKPRITSMMVHWDRPQGNKLKLNTDGSFIGSSKSAGIGGIVRKGNGDMVMAFTKSVDFSTNNSCELQVAVCGINWCCEYQQGQLILEMDSLVVVNMLKGQTTVPWNLRRVIKETQRKIQNCHIEVIHCYREANAVAGALAKLVATNPNTEEMIYREEDLPEITRGPLWMGKLHLASFRFKKCKHSGWYFEPR
ncbi:uncharacterized protein LOC132057959 [Lycium ferocissimum]|uniref:uncharacterized protein LOC132057959 n=1 Tax=Lycium ferocissimum TaxID=112874 RepID=UPI002814D1E2|nr:uncharacterized protein LOC132057959 [Lycium ferocissimum]